MSDHYYASVGDGRIVCACGHAEPVDDATFAAATGQMNAHIRSFYTDEEWETRMREAKLATFNMTTGTMTLPPEGPKS